MINRIFLITTIKFRCIFLSINIYYIYRIYNKKEPCKAKQIKYSSTHESVGNTREKTKSKIPYFENLMTSIGQSHASGFREKSGETLLRRKDKGKCPSRTLKVFQIFLPFSDMVWLVL